MFRVRQKQEVVADVVRELPREPRMEHPVTLRLEELEERIAPLAKTFDKASPLLM